MGEALVGSSVVASFCSFSSLRKGFVGFEFKVNRLINADRLQFRGLVFESKSQTSLLIVRSQVSRPTTYTSSIATDIPLYESPAASFDHYLEDKPRVFEAIFPDKRRSQQLNKDEWRIQMLPIQFLFLTVWPIIDMRLAYRTEGKDYPSGVPTDISRVVELNIIRWELKGLENAFKPSEFSLNVKGALYPDRGGGGGGARSRLKGQLQLSISFVLPPVLALVPEDVRRDVAESVLKSLVMNMKQKVNTSLLADYSKFKREKLKALV